MMVDDVRTQWTVAASRGSEAPPPLSTVLEEARQTFDDNLFSEPVEYDPDELAIRQAFRLGG